MKYRIITDAVTTEIESRNSDEAAKKFAQSEPIYRNLAIENEADLMAEAAKMGGWINIVEV